MKFKEVLSKLHPSQKLKWENGGDLTGKEFSVEDLKKWNDQGEYSSVSGDMSLALDGNKVFIIQHDHFFNLPNYPHKLKADIVIFSGTLEFV